MRLGTSAPYLPTYSCHADNEALGVTEPGEKKIRTSALVRVIQGRYHKATDVTKHARDTLADYFFQKKAKSLGNRK